MLISIGTVLIIRAALSCFFLQALKLHLKGKYSYGQPQQTCNTIADKITFFDSLLSISPCWNSSSAIMHTPFASMNKTKRRRSRLQRGAEGTSGRLGFL